MKPPIPWLRIVIEGVVIVGSILLAFGIDAWWTNRMDTKLERQYLEAFRLDVEQTRDDNARVVAEQSAVDSAMRQIAASIAAGEPQPDTILRVFPTVWILQESMDTYRDLVASGGTTRIRSLEVRRAMSKVLRQVEYNHLAQDWALGVVTSFRPVVWATPRPVDQQRLVELWAAYLDLGVRLAYGKRALEAATDTALAVLDAELQGR